MAKPKSDVTIKAPLIADGLVKIAFGGGTAAIATGFPTTLTDVVGGVEVTRTVVVEQWVLFKGTYAYTFDFAVADGGPPIRVVIESVPWPRRLPSPGVDAPTAVERYQFESVTQARITSDAFFAAVKSGVLASSGRTAWYVVGLFDPAAAIQAAPQVGEVTEPLFAERFWPGLVAGRYETVHVGSVPVDIEPQVAAAAKRRTHVLYRPDKVKLPPFEDRSLRSEATTALPDGVTGLDNWAAYAYERLAADEKDVLASQGDVYEFAPAQWLAPDGLQALFGTGFRVAWTG